MIGQSISHYRILEKLGEGGMGVVYKAQDTKLNRLVALKFLPQQVSASESDKARFLQEAQAAAALNHPNICTIYGIEEHEKQTFIVMEFVEGKTLREKKEAVSSKQAIEIGIQIADGLAAAHEKGIVHRDIKPENIMIRKDGIAQIMDFGLAKLRASGSKITRLTKEGSTVGTAGYMSPEQVQGQDTDHRTDIYSLGVLLYELIAGQSPYKGVHETAIMYEIVNEDPAPLSSIKPDVDPELDAMVLDCMAKDPMDRVQSVAELARNLRRFKRESTRQRVSRITTTRQAFRPTLPEVQIEKPSWKRFFWPALVGLVAIVALFFAWRLLRTGPSLDRPVLRFSVNLPTGAGLDFGFGFSPLAISPDGKYLAYTSSDVGKRGLTLRPMDQFTAQTLPGTEDAADPFFSPDGQWIAFFQQDKLQKVSVFGGAPQEICEVKGNLRGGWWAPDNSIYYGHINKGVQRVPAGGGRPEEATSLDTANGEISHRFPQLLPDGRTLIFTIKHSSISSFNEAVIVAQRLGTNERRVLIRGGTYGRYVPTGYLVYARGKSLYAAPFDYRQLEIKGPPAPILDGGMLNEGSGAAGFDFSRTGFLVYVPGGPLPFANNTLGWIDRRGRSDSLSGGSKSFFDASISPDGQKIAVTLTAANDDIWVYHITRGTLTRLTFGGGNSYSPLWTPDGKYVVYNSEKGRSSNIFWKPWDGSGAEERLTESVNGQVPNSWSPDGKLLAFQEAGDIWILPTENERKPWPFLQSSFNDHHAAFSPSGHLMAYASDESGKDEVYVVPFPKRGAKWQISIGGGSWPMWSRNGKELFYLKDKSVMQIDVTLQPAFSWSVPRKLFDLPPTWFRIIDLAPDGQRFLVGLSRSQELRTTQVNVVLEWFKELDEKFASQK